MKFNWGTGIVIVSLCFMSFIVMLVVKTYSHKVDLVSEDYYDQELNFQTRINKMNNTREESKVIWHEEEETIVFQFPKRVMDTSMNGTIEFFRPSDSSKDLIIPIQTDGDGKQYVRKELLLRGLYKIKIDWTIGPKGYYMEEDVFI